MRLEKESLLEYLRGTVAAAGAFRFLLTHFGVTPVSDGDAGLVAWTAVDAGFARETAGVGDAHIAVTSGDVERVRAVVASGADLGVLDRRAGRTPVEWALDRGRTDMAVVLLDGVHLTRWRRCATAVESA
jgi:hypothetical protein